MTQPCPVAFYQPSYGASADQSCIVCPSGTYCDVPGLSVPNVCPQGYYCVTGSQEPQPCPLGTYSNSTSLKKSSQCLLCPGGRYCDGVGQTSPAGYCDPGFYCREGSFTKTPVDGPTGGLCPAGGYCLKGTVTPYPCPAGTFSNVSGASDNSSCTSCTPGYYCEGSNIPEPSGPCYAGYYCTGGASSPTQYSTNVGYYSVSGSSMQSPCSPGSYQPQLRSSSCLTCLAGYYWFVD